MLGQASSQPSCLFQSALHRALLCTISAAMSELALAPTRYRNPDKRIDRPGPAVRRAIADMIENGTAFDVAAQTAGLSTRQLRLAFEKPSVREYIKRQRDVFCAAVNTKNIFRLGQIRDAADNMPAVNAIKELESISETRAIVESGSKQTPGIVINILAGNAQSNDRQSVNVTIPNESLTTTPNSELEDGRGEK